VRSTENETSPSSLVAGSVGAGVAVSVAVKTLKCVRTIETVALTY